jgi:hypothetical protein
LTERVSFGFVVSEENVANKSPIALGISASTVGPNPDSTTLRTVDN